MPRYLTSDPQLDDELVKTGKSRLEDLESYITSEVEDALSARHAQEEEWIENLRQYEAVPSTPIPSEPIEGRENIETPLGAIAADAIYAQELALIFGTTPILTARATSREFVDNAKAAQRFINFLTKHKDFGFRIAVEETTLDKSKLGTGCYYIPYVVREKRTRTSRVTSHGPKARSIAPEDVLAPGGAYHDPEDLPWISIRQWYSQSDLIEQANVSKWNITDAKQAATVDRVRRQREMLGRTAGDTSRRGDLFETWLMWVQFDINDDGLEEDLFVAWDRTSKKIMRYRYNPYDRIPLVITRYLRRGKLFYGRGVLSITAPNQRMATDTMNYWLDNAFLANIRAWAAKGTSSLGETLHLWPGRVVDIDPDDIQPLVLADVYTSMPQLFQANMMLTERLTGINSLTQSPMSALGKRTPATTAGLAVQNQNQRFAPVFGAGRVDTAEVVMQFLYRYQERLLAGDPRAEEFIRRILREEADALLNILRRDTFDESMEIELTASSTETNVQRDQQNMLTINQILGAYYDRILQLTMLAQNPQIPQGVVSVIRKITKAWSELLERVLRTFDQVRDPQDFLVELDGALRDVEAASTPDDIASTIQTLQGFGGNGAAPGA